MSSQYVKLPLVGSGGSANSLEKGTKTIFCIDNGDYATGQDAVNAATAGDTIVFGVKTGGWGNLVIPAGKKLSLMGLQSERAVFAKVGSITFSPTTGAQITENELYLDSLYVDPDTAITAITFGGTAPARIRINNCYIYANTNNSCVVLSNSHATSSAYITETAIVTLASTAHAIDSSCAYTRCYRTTVEGSCSLLRVTAGTFEIEGSNFNGACTGAIINLTGGVTIAGRSLISNTTTNGTGVAMSGANTVLANSFNTWNVATGTGYCISGIGLHLYGPILVADNALLPGNKKIQNTITSLAYTTSFTPSA